MNTQKTILAIIGSARERSANLQLVQWLSNHAPHDFHFNVYNSLKQLPHFDPELSANNPPQKVNALRTAIEGAAGVIICTPEYVFSIPSGLKNAIEWCVATTIFTDKPLGIITASASGETGHQELQRIMRTLMADFSSDTTLLIQGVKGKINDRGEINDATTQEALLSFIEAFSSLVAHYIGDNA
jgi:chromate reductase, NAD(P)H dehydrogenase (quinone)